ncbi:hypothetical protein [Poseidonibacter lekithochrous]|uniref:hypothetical protein n=1 Tax=Poseidonibacter lekithochrous TaxID=1904463 RepID=UPI000D3670B1|nr:hypothetical protein [Poseidonibacter lekithochrous]
MDNFSHEKEITKEITKEMIEEFIQSHKDKVNEAIENKELYAYCIYRHKHYIKSFEEYEELISNESPVFIYGL